MAIIGLALTRASPGVLLYITYLVMCQCYPNCPDSCRLCRHGPMTDIPALQLDFEAVELPIKLLVPGRTYARIYVVDMHAGMTIILPPCIHLGTYSQAT